jgi:prolyl oligopeptidase
VYAHAVGSDPKGIARSWAPASGADIVTDPLATPIVVTAPGSTYALGIVGNGNQREFAVWAAPVASLAKGVPAWRRVAGLDDEVTDAALIGSTLYVLTHRKAPHFKVLRVDLASPDLARRPSSCLKAAPSSPASPRARMRFTSAGCRRA